MTDSKEPLLYSFKAALVFVLIGVIISAGILFTACGPSEEEKAEERRKGLHCLNAVGGANRDVLNTMKQELNDPDSFKHVETRITAVNANGEHHLTMKFRAKNSLGATVLTEAKAVVQHDTCEAEIYAIE